MFETRRLFIRKYSKNDLDFVMSIWNDSVMGKYLSDPFAEDIDDDYMRALETLEDNSDCCYLIAEDKLTAKGIGTFSYYQDNSSEVYDIAYSVHSDYWKRGYATEMMEVILDYLRGIGGKRITITIAQDNIGSNALARKFDFQLYDKGSFQKSGTDLVFEDYKYELYL